MSHDYDTSTYIADLAGIPGTIDSPDGLSGVARAAFEQQRAVPAKLVRVSGSTRSGWAIYLAKALARAANLPSLAFLGDEGDQRFENEYGFECITVLHGPRLAGVLADLRQLLHEVRGNPMLAMNADEGGILNGAEEVAKALARDYVSSKPAYDYGNVVGDDGQSEDYLFTWLRSILRVGESALAEEKALVHHLKV